MYQAQWLRRMALMALLVAAGCGGDNATGGDGDREGDDAGGSGTSGNGASGADSDAAASAGHDAAVAATQDAGAAQGGAQGGAGAQDTFLRVDTFVLKKPGLVLRVLGVESDVTSDVQDMLDMSLAEDTEPADGNVDLTMLVRFSAAGDPAQAAGKVTFGGGLCVYPLDATKACHTDASAPFFDPAMTYSNANKCQLEGATDAVSPGACFQTAGKGRMAVSLPLFGPVVLDDAQVIGSWANAGKDGVVTGWIRGFVSEQTAMTTKIQGAVPAHLALLDIQTGSPLTGFLPQTKETGPSGAGWSFLAQFSAKPAHFEAGTK